MSFGRIFPTSDMKATGLVLDCSTRYSTPPAWSNACRIMSLSSPLSLLVDPFGLPLPAAGGFRFVVSVISVIFTTFSEILSCCAHKKSRSDDSGGTDG